MRIKAITMTYLLLSVCAFAGMAQAVEYDDMYFNAKDRAKLRAQKASEEVAYVASAKKAKANVEEEESLNPTDSYSARNVNPEFAARSNAKTAQTDNEDYYVNDYQYSTTSNLNNWNNNFNSWYSNPWYSSNYYGSSINSWNSPYYGYYDPYYSPWYDPYWSNNGWSTSFSYHWGNSWNYGWGGNYNYWNRPYCGWASSWGPSWYGNPYYNYYGYSNVVVVNNYGEGRKVTYGKRNSRSTESNYSRDQQNASTTGRTTFTPSPDGNGSRSTNGRSSGTNSRSSSSTDEYYNRTWRRVTQEPASTTSNNGNSGGRSSTNDSYSNYNRSSSDGNSSWNRSNESRSSYTPSRSSSSYDGGGSRSSYGGGGSSSGGSRSSGSSSRSRGN